MPRLWLSAAALVAALACFDAAGPGRSPRLLLKPLLDSLFVGDTQTPRLTVTYVSANGDTQPVGPIAWASDADSVATVDATGRVVARGRGAAIISATANGVTGRALVVVTRPLDVALLLDTMYLMPGDTFPVPVVVRRKSGVPPEPWFEAPAQAVFAIDSATGRVTANAAGGPIAFVVHADTVADTGAVQVVALQDTTGGLAYFTLLGTVIRRQGAGARALNYRAAGAAQGFQLQTPVVAGGGTVERVVLTLRSHVTGPGTFAVDSISPEEALGTGGADFICRPPRSWAIWSTSLFSPPVNALSRRGGTITINQVDTVTGGLAVSGWYRFDAQRMDLYEDPAGLLPVRGTFVAPLVTNLTTCP
ncbi:MAG TPA: Ig-like domain-containing protein [Gemmatimonadales bacterium]|nr:Ig-like domain-containing protein [Gemmatimonadales bacterium]